jgi:hypothetical protein
MSPLFWLPIYLPFNDIIYFFTQSRLTTPQYLLPFSRLPPPHFPACQDCLLCIGHFVFTLYHSLNRTDWWFAIINPFW